MTQKTYQYVNNFWDDTEAGKQSGVDRLIYRSNKLGADQRITNTSGGNTSSKLTDKDPLTGQTVEVLWVKGSGGDLRPSSCSTSRRPTPRAKTRASSRRPRTTW